MPEHRALGLSATGCEDLRGRFIVKNKIIKIQMLPSALALINQAQENALSLQRPQIHDLPLHGLILTLARSCMKNLISPGLHDFNSDGSRIAGRRPYQKTCPGLCHLEWHGGQRASAFIRMLRFVSADPELPHMMTGLAWLSWPNCVAFDRLTFKRIAFRFPILERAIFKGQIERLTIDANGMENIGLLSRLLFRGTRQGGFPQVSELNFPKLNFSGTRSGMQLKGQSPTVFGGVGFMIVQCSKKDPIHPRLHAGSRGFDAINIPIVSLHEFLKGLRLGKRIRPASAIRGDGNAGAPLHHQRPAMLIINAPQPLRTIVQITLQTARHALGIPLATDLNSTVGRRTTGDAVLQFQFKITHLTIPEYPFVVIQAGLIFYFPGDRPILHAPQSRIALPAFEGLTIEKRHWLCRSDQTGKYQGNQECSMDVIDHKKCERIKTQCQAGLPNCYFPAATGLGWAASHSSLVAGFVC